MNATIEIIITIHDEQVKDQLIAQLADIEFDAFEERDGELSAFTHEEKFNPTTLIQILLPFQLQYKKNIIEEKNWNALWESNFQPVVVDNFCAVRAHFHPAFTLTKHEIIITPKMSFGTGHHSTTFMMLQQMGNINFENKVVADFGTGTGVLAILAEKLGSSSVWAIDIDDWSIENATENIEKNNCCKIALEKKDSFTPRQKFNIILANINKNVILSNVNNLTSATISNGQILVSGLLKQDETDILEVFTQHGFLHRSTVERNNWICMLFQS